MKNIIKSIISGLVITLLPSCSAESPFDIEKEGTVRFDVSVNYKTTRAEDDANKYTQEYLLDNCNIVISGEKGVLHHWKGRNEIPGSINLRYGDYTIDGWSGDSVPASFTAKYFRGHDTFSLQAETATVALVCKLANVVASVNEETINSKYVKDLNVRFYNDGGYLDFNSDNFNAKGYFMMSSYDLIDKSDPSSHRLYYVVTGKTVSGKNIRKEGYIDNVKRAHEYRINFRMDPSQGGSDPVGGTQVALSVSVDESLIEFDQNMSLLGAPKFRWANDRDLDSQIVGEAGQFTNDEELVLACFGALSELHFETSNDGILPNNSINYFKVTSEVHEELANRGITVTLSQSVANEVKYMIEFSRKWLNSLPVSSTPYEVRLTAVDSQNKATSMKVSVATSSDAVTSKAPVEPADGTTLAANLMAVGATKAVIPLTINDTDVPDLKLQYRQEGAAEWNEVPINPTRASKIDVTLSGLTPGTTYQYRTAWGGDKAGVSDVSTFHTETIFIIPNASMEDWSDWSDNTKVLIPGADGQRTFWDTGNHGSSTMGKTITNKGTSLLHSGSASAELKSQFVGLGAIGKFAAGNIFTGSYVRTDGTDGVLSFGRPYDGSHPESLSVWVNYRPGTGIAKKGANASYINEGELDKAQIYVALTTEPVEIKTKEKERQLFDPDGTYVVAYGEKTFDSSFGPDGQMAQVTIPLSYKDKAKNTKPKYLVIVVSASKYGDYFSGGEGSLMYVDDFELIY